MTLKATRQTTLEYGSYLYCHGCGEAADHGTVLEANANLHGDGLVVIPWFRRCLAALEAWLTQGRGSGVIVP